MGYNRSPKTIARVKPILDKLVEADDTIEWSFKEPQKVAYRIFEAVKFAIKSGKKEYEQYATILDKYRIRVIEPDIVKAEIRLMMLTSNGIIVREADDAISVIGSALSLKQDVMIFPNFKKEEEELELVKKWCGDNSYLVSFDTHNRLMLAKWKELGNV